MVYKFNLSQQKFEFCYTYVIIKNVLSYRQIQKLYKKVYLSNQIAQRIYSRPKTTTQAVKYTRFNKKNSVPLDALFKDDALGDGKIFVSYEHAISSKNASKGRPLSGIISSALQKKNPRCASTVKFILGNYIDQ